MDSGLNSTIARGLSGPYRHEAGTRDIAFFRLSPAYSGSGGLGFGFVWHEKHLRAATHAAGVTLWSWNVDAISMDERHIQRRGCAVRLSSRARRRVDNLR